MTAAVAAVCGAGIALAAGTGELKFVDAKFSGQGGVTGLDFAWDVAVSPNGRNVYATGADSDSVVTFKRGSKSGKLRFVNAKFDGQGGVEGLYYGANGLAMSPDGRSVYVTGAQDNALATFRRNRRTGKLRFVNAKFDGQDGIDGLDGDYDVAVSPSGRSVYVVSTEDSALAKFKRNRRTGKLRFVSERRDDEGGVDGLQGAFAVAISPDGDSVYVASTGDNALATFRRGRHGRLRFVNAKFDGRGGAMLESPGDVQVSPDGRNVYVSAQYEDAVDTFRRDRESGRLKFVNAKVDGQGGVDGMNTATGVTVSPDGRNVYLDSFEGAVAEFKRKPTTGRLRFVDAIFNGQDGVDGLDGPNYMTSSPDGENVYVAGFLDNSLVTFKRG